MPVSMITGTPSSSIRSRTGSTRRPSTAASPFTVTRPSAINASFVRREPNPARASTFWSRSPSSASAKELELAAGRLDHVDLDHVDLVRGRLVFVVRVGVVRTPVVRVDRREQETAFEGLDNRRLGYEVGEC